MMSFLIVVVVYLILVVFIIINPTTTTSTFITIPSTFKLKQQIRSNHDHYDNNVNKISKIISIDHNMIRSTRIKTKPLYGISEWRDLIFDYPGTGLDRRLGIEVESCTLPKEICILPFPYQDVLLQGETKQLRLYEDRFKQLFNTCINEHCSVCAMGMIASSGIIQTVPIVEIEAYNNGLVDEFGIFVTIRVVGRAKLLDIVQQTPFMKAVCIEITDTIPPNLELPCLLASNIETSMIQLSSMEHRLEMAKKSGEIDTSKYMTNSTMGMDPNDIDVVMQHRIRLAKLEDTYYDDTYDDDEDDDEEEENENDKLTKNKETDIYIDRRKRFRRAYEVALATDTQGYQVHAPSNISTAADRTAQELTAISWAAFCTEVLPEIDAAVRIQALDCDNVFNRLKLASGLMRQKKALLRARMEKAGLRVSNDDEFNEGPSVE